MDHFICLIHLSLFREGNNFVTGEIAAVTIILLSVLLLLLCDIISADLVAVIIILTLVLSRILTIEEAFAGFGNPVIITVGALFIICGGLYRTALSSLIGKYLTSLGAGSETRTIATIMAAGAVVSSVMTNVAATAILMPGVIILGQKTGIAPSRLLIPLSYGTILGGTITLVGTQPNLIVSSMLMTTAGREFNFFDFTPIGLTLTVLGIAFMVTVGRHFLPIKPADEKLRRSVSLQELPSIYRLEERLFELKVPEGSILVGKSLQESQVGTQFGINVIGIMKKDKMHRSPRRDDVIQSGDRLLIQGREGDVQNMAFTFELEIHRRGSLRDDEILSREVGVAEIVLPPRSQNAGKQLRDVLLRERYGLTVLAIWRMGKPIRAHLAEEVLQVGDALLVWGPWENIRLLKKFEEFLLVTGPADDGETPRRDKMLIAAALLSGMIFSVVSGILTLPVAALAAAVLMILTRCLTLAEAYKAVEWRVIMIIAGFIPFGDALVKTGLVDVLVKNILFHIGQLGPSFIIGTIFLLSSVLSLFTTNIAAAVLMSPVAINTATACSIKPEILLICVAIGASNGFVSPLAQQANLLVMGPGNYVFKDYIKAGAILSIIVFAAVMVFMPLFWKLYG